MSRLLEALGSEDVEVLGNDRGLLAGTQEATDHAILQGRHSAQEVGFRHFLTDTGDFAASGFRALIQTGPALKIQLLTRTPSSFLPK